MSSKNPQEPSHNLDAIKKALADYQPGQGFCTYWPQAKSALEDLLTAINDLGLPEAVTFSLKACIKSVIAVGEAAYANCAQEQTS